MSATQTPGDLEAPASRRDQSVARVIDPARRRAVARVQKFVDAAHELVLESGQDFTLQDVVDRSGLSLRSFYQHFGGKHELLLALFEESVRSSELVVRAKLEGVADPLERVHRLLVEYYLVCAQEGGGRQGSQSARTVGASGQQAPALTAFAQQLLAQHPQEAATAIAPILDLFHETLGAAAAAGVVTPAVRTRRTAAFVAQTVMFNAFVDATTRAVGSRARRTAAEELYQLLLHGLLTR